MSLQKLPENVRGQAIFSVENLCFAYGGADARMVLDGVNLALFAGQCLGLIGDNGSGKTTLFRCITGLAAPQQGDIRLGGMLMRTEKDFHKLRCQVGYVLQESDDQLFFPTVIEDIAFGPLNLGYSKGDARNIAVSALELVGLAGFEERLTYHLSGGEKKLAAIAAVLAMKPRALLLDEPLNGLDMAARAKITKVIGSLDCAKLIISHDYALFSDIGAKCLYLENGKLKCQNNTDAG